MSLSRKTRLQASTPLAPMSARKRAALAAAGVANPLSTLATGAPRKPMMRTAAAVKRGRYTPAVPVDVKDALKVRSGGWCEVAMTGCIGGGVDPSHRITTKSGGRHGTAKKTHDRLSNVLWACRACHDWIGEHPAASKVEQVGWALEEWQQPTACPVLYRGRLVFLDDAGNVHEYEAGAA